MVHLKKQVLSSYKNLLKYSKLVVDSQIFFRNVPITQKQHIHQIYTQKQNKPNLPHLVLLHGFAGTAMSYIRLFQRLSQHYQVHALDHFGNGLSSRSSNNNFLSQKQTLEVYVNSIEKWRIKRNIENFAIVGHSFGGYLASLYTREYFECVNRLVLLSPVGTSDKVQIMEQLTRRKNKSFKHKAILNCLQKVYQIKLQPYTLFSKPIIGDYLLNVFLKSKILLQEQQILMWKQYLIHITNQENCLQKSFYKCFQWPFISKHDSINSLIDELQKHKKMQVQFYFGQNDWTEQTGAIKLSQSYLNVSHKIIDGANHNMIFDYPNQVAEQIIQINQT